MTESNGPDPSRWSAWRQRTADILYSKNREDTWTHRFDIGIIVLVALNVVAVILESVASIRAAYGDILHVFELVSVAIFSAEYLLRVWSSVNNPWVPPPSSRIRTRLRFIRTPMAIVDLLAILPFYLGLLVQVDLRFLRVLRLLRILKLTRYSGSMTLLFQVLRQEAKTVGAAMFVLLLVLVIASSLAFIAEGEAHPQGAFSSIPATTYWAIITMTTVGYGDIVPATAAGKMLTAVIALISVGIVALPAGILASGFSAALQRRREEVEDRIEDALADGDLSDAESAEIEHLIERLNLSPADFATITTAVRRDRHKDDEPCPHCGKRRAET